MERIRSDRLGERDMKKKLITSSVDIISFDEENNEKYGIPTVKNPTTKTFPVSLQLRRRVGIGEPAMYTCNNQVAVLASTAFDR